MGRARIALVVWTIAVAGCGDKKSPEAVCGHVVELRREAGVDVKDTKAAVARCRTRLEGVLREYGVAVSVEVAVCMRGANKAGELSRCDAHFIATGVHSANRSNVREAHGNLRTLYKRVNETYRRSRAGFGLGSSPGYFPASSSGPAPPLGTCCSGDGRHCYPDRELWRRRPWIELDFALERPHWYSYEYKRAPDGKSFTVAAYGDLDCDGEYSTFKMIGGVDASGLGDVIEDRPNE